MYLIILYLCKNSILIPFNKFDQMIWNKTMECMDRDRLREIQSKRLSIQVKSSYLITHTSDQESNKKRLLKSSATIHSALQF